LDGGLPDDGGAASEIKKELQRKLTGARRLPFGDRAGARQAAIEWRNLALAALQEKLAAERWARAVANGLKWRNKPRSLKRNGDFFGGRLLTTI